MRPSPSSFRIERGRIKTDPDFRVQGFENVWALGDCAAVPNAYDGQLCPPTAQFATRQAKWLNRNLRAGVRHAHLLCARDEAVTGHFAEARTHYQAGLNLSTDDGRWAALCKWASCELKAAAEPKPTRSPDRFRHAR